MYYDIKKSGTYIQKLRTQHGYTQEHLARLLNIDRSFLSRVESGKKGCSVDMLAQISQFFEVSLDSVVFGGEKRQQIESTNHEQLKKDIDELIVCLERFTAHL